MGRIRPVSYRPLQKDAPSSAWPAGNRQEDGSGRRRTRKECPGLRPPGRSSSPSASGGMRHGGRDCPAEPPCKSRAHAPLASPKRVKHLWLRQKMHRRDPFFKKRLHHPAALVLRKRFHNRRHFERPVHRLHPRFAACQKRAPVAVGPPGNESPFTALQA